MNKFVAAKQHTIKRIFATKIRHHPFVHSYVENVFPPAFYAEMQQRLPADSSYRRLIDTGKVSKAYNAARWCYMLEDAQASQAESENAAFWHELFHTYGDAEFVGVWVDYFKDAIRDRMERGEMPHQLNGDFNAAPEMYLMRDHETYALPPHTDSPQKVVAALFYLPPDDSLTHLGTALYRPKDAGRRDSGAAHLDPGGFEKVKTMAFRPNSMFAFPKTAVSYHGVEAVAGENRRDVMLYDIKLYTREALMNAERR